VFYHWKPYVPAAERRRKAERAAARLRKRGGAFSPVTVDGRTIVTTFWGKAWCDNLERYSDYSNRLPRGRSYVRNGSVLDLKIGRGEVSALVSGSRVYTVRAQVSAVTAARWQAICADCAGGIDSLVELLQGRFSRAVMERLCRQETGLFPSPKEIRFSCSCPDWAAMCKHVAAVFYGIGARLDESPELLFELRKIDPATLLAKAGGDLSLGARRPASGRVLAEQGIAEIFGIELAESARAHPLPETKASRPGASPAVRSKKAMERVPAEQPGKKPRRQAASGKAGGRHADNRSSARTPRSSRRRGA
jgi:uncharacterized Zn finger protein